MRVGRGDTLVYLARVRVGNDAPYVVVDATSPALTLTAGPGPDGVVTAGGTRTSRTAPQVVDLRPPGAAEPLLTARATASDGGWGVELVPPGPRPPVRTDAVAAWTLDGDGRVAAFAADSATG